MQDKTFEKGVNAYDRQEYEEAKTFFLEAIIEEPNRTETYLFLAKAYYFCEQSEQAIAPLDQYIEFQQNNTDDLLNRSHAFALRGLCHAKALRLDLAKSDYDVALEIDPFCIAGWHNKGLLFLMQAQNSLDNTLPERLDFFKSALNFFTRALMIGSNIPSVLHDFASCHEQYLETLKDEIDLNPEVEEVNLPKITRHYETAINHYKKALAVCREEDTAQKNRTTDALGECFIQYGNYLRQYFANDELAYNYYIQARELDPININAINKVGVMLRKQGLFTQAREECFIPVSTLATEALDLSNAWLNIGDTLIDDKHFDEAKIALENAKKFAPLDEEVLSTIGEVESKLREAVVRASLVRAPQILLAKPAKKPTDTAPETASNLGYF